MNDGKWRLPHGVEELLPPAAAALERLRRDVLDLFTTWGYEHIEPPLVEYLDSLLVGSGADLDLQTLKVVDQRSGRMLGVRADLTSQAVRIDAHSRPKAGIQRLCYAGPVVFANPRGALDSRNPYKAGAELFGCEGLDADAEVVELMLAALGVAGVTDPVLLLGHMGVYGALTADLGLNAEDERSLFDAVQRKAESDIAALLPAGSARDFLVALPTMMGRAADLEAAAGSFAGAPAGARRAIDDLRRLTERLQGSGVQVRFDLSELAGYGYHNGPVFAAYQADQGASLAQGGRYDNIGRSFGRGRPATGFDMRLERLISVVAEPSSAIWAPLAASDRALAEAVAVRRAAGDVVVCALAEGETADVRCDRVFMLENGSWIVKELEN
jgi:ATP phosphoribosyltransferase regulatory subunit